mmetsp:Transcript_8666/g.14694  ORF Transcript_8666/g.14694 Transcript_8666/m.14694 type:complete len:90 (-) Transcript_8666:446-715(-)
MLVSPFCRTCLPCAPEIDISFRKKVKPSALRAWFDEQMIPSSFTSSQQFYESYNQEHLRLSAMHVGNIIEEEASHLDGDYSRIFLGGHG